MTTYEWIAEGIDVHGDIIDIYHAETAAQCLAHAAMLRAEYPQVDFGLVCDTDTGRSWAYVDADGVLSSHTEDAYGRQARKVPARYQREWARALEGRS